MNFALNDLAGILRNLELISWLSRPERWQDAPPEL